MRADPPDTLGCLVLIVEDLPETRMLRKEYLEMEGYRVIEAEDGQQGVAAAIHERPRLILMNYLMPVMNGLEATRLIRREPSLAGVPILMNSACSPESMREAAIEAGCNDYLEEPCFFDDLLDAMARFTGTTNNPNE